MFQLVNQKYEENVPVSSLKLHPANPRQGDVGAIAISISENGFFGAIGVQVSTRFVVWGNHTYLAAKSVGAKTIPVFWLDVDDVRAAKILAADNKTSDLATYNEENLAELLQKIHQESSTGLLGTGFDGDDLDELIKNITPPDLGGSEGGEGLDQVTNPPSKRKPLSAIRIRIDLELYGGETFDGSISDDDVLATIRKELYLSPEMLQTLRDKGSVKSHIDLRRNTDTWVDGPVSFRTFPVCRDCDGNKEIDCNSCGGVGFLVDGR